MFLGKNGTPHRKGQAMVEAQPRVRYWILHWLRVALWPMPIVTLFKAARIAVNTARHWHNQLVR